MKEEENAFVCNTCTIMKCSKTFLSHIQVELSNIDDNKLDVKHVTILVPLSMQSSLCHINM